MFSRKDLKTTQHSLLPSDLEGMAMEYFNAEDGQWDSLEEFGEAVKADEVTLWHPFENMDKDAVIEHCEDLACFLDEVYEKGRRDGKDSRFPIRPAPVLSFLFVTECDGAVEVTRVVGASDYNDALSRIEAASDQPFTSMKVINCMVIEGNPPMRLVGEVFDL